jgi:Zn-dependent protease
LKNRTWQSLVSLAGPTANLIVLIILGIVLRFTPLETSDKNSIWPGIAFLALLQASALVLNLIPLPPFDGYGILEPFLNPDLRDRINSMRTWIMLLVFLALWNIPAVNNMFWTQVYIIAYRLGVPWDLAWAGFDRFRFWML